MVELIFIIAIIAYVIKAGKKAQEQQQSGTNTQAGTYSAPQRATRVDSAKVQVRQQVEKSVQEQIERTKQRLANKKPSILERAIANAEEDKEDVTLKTMEEEHNHSERVSAAVHHHPEDILPDNLLGTVEDLMVKGYDGNLCFERDFVGEGLDMISRFTC